ncbi:MAG: DUF2905 domain-containing protein [Candidatus Goldiibacteriota bacterium]
MQEQIGKFLIIAGIVVIAAGIILVVFKNIPLGRLPGDIKIEKGSTNIYIPITTSILISIVLSIIFFLTGRK